MNFGDNASIEEQLSMLEKERAEILSEAEALENENKTLIKTTEDTIHDIFTRRKGKSKIKTKSHKDGVHEKVVGLWVDEYIEALKLFPKEDYGIISGEDNLSKNLDAITNVNLPSIVLPTDEDYREIGRILNKTYDTSTIPVPEVVKWLEIGVGLHHGKQACEFCLSKVDIIEIEDRVAKYTQNAQSIDSKKIEDIISSIASIATKVRGLVTSKLGILIAFDNHTDAELFFNDLEIQLEYTEKYTTALSEKLNNMAGQKEDISGDLKIP